MAHALELDVSSCGGTKEKALKNLKEAVRLFLEEAEKMGSLKQILQEAGYSKTGQLGPKYISVQRVTLPPFRSHMPKLSPVSYKELVKVFEADGFHWVRTEGDHMVFTKTGVLRPIVIPKYAAVPVFVIKNNLRTAGMSRDRYFELLNQ